MIYEFIWQDQCVQLDSKQKRYNWCHPSPIAEPNKRTRWPYDCLLKPDDYFDDDDSTILELVKAWYRSCTFLVKNPELINKSLENFTWTTDLKPIGLIRRVETNVRITSDTAEQEKMSRKVQLLGRYVDRRATITIILENLQELLEAGDSVKDYMGNAACVFPILRTLTQPHVGFRFIIRPRLGKCNVRFAVVCEEITVQDWTEKVDEATRRFAHGQRRL